MYRFTTLATLPNLRGIAARAVLASALLACAPFALAINVSFDLDFTRSTYQVQADDTFNDLLDAHYAGAHIASGQSDGLEGVDTRVSANGVVRNFSVLLSTDLELAAAGTYEFQIGADWGRGGGVALFDTDTGEIVSERVITDNIWWANNWNNSDVISTSYALERGNYQIAWVGFEDCCSGLTTVRYSFEGSQFENLSATSIAPLLVPTGSTAGLLGFGLLCLGVVLRLRTRASKPVRDLDHVGLMTELG